MTAPPRVRLGIDVLQADGFAALRHKRVGLLTSFAAVDTHLRRTYDILRTDLRVRLAALFAPEHGLDGTASAGERVLSSVDARTGLRVHSLYGSTFRPTPEMLADIEAVVFDIPDVGARFFTFVWTLAYVMAVAHDVEIIVLDRPNPLGGEIIEGGALDPALLSLIGGDNVPIRHGMTMGELARMIYAGWDDSLSRLTVVPCEGWRRSMLWEDTGLAWSPPSPNMPHSSTALHYPGACLIEGTTLSEGRGTPLPFEIVGAPYIDEMALAEALNALELPGVRFRPHVFVPSVGKWAWEVCRGVQAHITDSAVWRPVETWLHVIVLLRRLYPADFRWLPAESGIHHFDRLMGSMRTRTLIDNGATTADLMRGWDEYHARFRQARAPYLLYP